MINIFDVGIILSLIMFFIVGFKNGVIKETVSLVGIIVVFILSYALKGIVGNILCIIFPFIKFKGNIAGLVTVNIFFYQTIAFILVFSILLSLYALCLKLSKFVQKIVNMTIILWIPSKILGGFVSLIKGYIICFIIVLFFMIPFGTSNIFKESAIVNTMLYKTPIISNCLSSFIKPFEEIYDLGIKMSKDDITIEEANVKSLEIMLKYNVVSKSTIRRLKEMNKIDEIDDIEKILENY